MVQFPLDFCKNQHGYVCATVEIIRISPSYQYLWAIYLIIYTYRPQTCDKQPLCNIRNVKAQIVRIAQSELGIPCSIIHYSVQRFYNCTAKALVGHRACAGWSGLSFFAYDAWHGNSCVQGKSGQRRPGSDCAPAQSDQGLCCPLTKPNTVDYILIYSKYPLQISLIR